MTPWIHYDFLGEDFKGRAPLDSQWARHDLSIQAPLQPGDSVVLYAVDMDFDGTQSFLLAKGTVEFDPEHTRWVATFDRNTVKRNIDMSAWPIALGRWQDRA
jgi:hypothetical protein